MSMFDVDLWRSEIQRRSRRFIRKPRQEAVLFGTDRLLYYLTSRVFEPFFEAFATEPLQAVTALGRLTQGSGTTFLIHNAGTLRYSQQLLWSELEHSAALRMVLEQVLLKLDVIEFFIHQLDDLHSAWFRDTVRDEIEVFRQQGELLELRQALQDMPWQIRYEAIQTLQSRAGHYTPADLQLISSALEDRASVVRSAAARQLGRIKALLPGHLRDRLFELALYDRDLGTRYAAARALGMIRDQLIDVNSRELLTTALFHDDSFVRSAASLVLTQLGAAMATPTIIESLLTVLGDPDPYAREAAATALSAMGLAAATTETLAGLTNALLDADQYVHEAALAALRILQALHSDEQISSTLA